MFGVTRSDGIYLLGNSDYQDPSEGLFVPTRFLKGMNTDLVGAGDSSRAGIAISLLGDLLGWHAGYFGTGDFAEAGEMANLTSAMYVNSKPGDYSLIPSHQRALSVVRGDKEYAEMNELKDALHL